MRKSGYSAELACEQLAQIFAELCLASSSRYSFALSASASPTAPFGSLPWSRILHLFLEALRFDDSTWTIRTYRLSLKVSGPPIYNALVTRAAREAPGKLVQ